MNDVATNLLHELILTKHAHEQAMHELEKKMDRALECVRDARVALSRDPNAHKKHDIIDYKLNEAIETLIGE